MQATPILVELVDAPLPAPLRRGKSPVEKDTLFALLGTMEVGGKAVDVNRAARSVRHYVYKFRVAIAPETQYVMREQRVGWTRIWRVK